MNLSEIFQAAKEKIAYWRRKNRYHPPVVSILNPGPEAIEVTNETIDLSGRVDRTRASITVVKWNHYQNQETPNGMCELGDAENWTALGIKLIPGENLITVTAVDTLGQCGSDAVVVVYTPE